jgi:opacity protein-like surface antigen
MKRLGLVLAMALAIVGGAFAQSSKIADAAADQSAPQVTQISGNLALINGHVAIKSGDKTYYLQGIQRLLGFVDGLKEGSSVKVEGYSLPMQAAPEYVFMRLTKLTFNGKAYDLSQAGLPYNRGCVGGRGDKGGMGGMLRHGRR